MFDVFHLPVRARLTSAVWLAALCAVLYFAADRLQNVVFSEGWTIFWPLNGVTIALLIVRPRGEWAPIIFGVALGTGAGEFFDNSFTTTILQRFFSITEVLLSAIVLPRFTSLEDWLRQPSLYRKFCTALVLGPVVSGIAAAALAQHMQGQSFWVGFNNWATSDALGIAIVMPMALAIRSPEFRCLFAMAHLARTLAVFALTLGVCTLIFLQLQFQMFFVLYPVLLLVDSTLGFGGSAIALPMACLIAVYGKTHALGPFGHIISWLPVSSDIALQVFLGFHVLALFPASILFRQRKLLQLELKQTNLQLVALAAVDGLTGIPNRRSLDEHFALGWTQAARLRQPLALMMMDIDHFKQFNDRYGHLAGDACLKKVAALLDAQRHRAREIVARFGGEEFAILLTGVPEDELRTFTGRVLQAIESADIHHEGSGWGRITLSAGCAMRVPTGTESPNDLLKLADAALYRAKKQGRNNVQFDLPVYAAPILYAHTVPAQEKSPAPAITG